MNQPLPVGIRLERTFVIAAGIAATLVKLPLAKLTGREPDCWRRTLGLGLRSDATKFCLSAFGLDVFSDTPATSAGQPSRDEAQQHFAQRLERFLANEPDAHWALKYHRHFVERVPLGSVDVVMGRFSANGDLQSVSSLHDARLPTSLETEAERAVEQALCHAHRATRNLSEFTRPNALLNQARESLPTGTSRALRVAMESHCHRLTEACFVSFESMPCDSAARFLPPDFRLCRSFGSGLLNAAARLTKDGRRADLWMQVHHAGADGAPMQAMLVRLERAWGVPEAPAFPADDPTKPTLVVPLQPSPQDRPIDLVVDFGNFTPMLRWRATVNSQLGGSLGEPVPLACVFLWHLAQQPEFAGRKFSTAVDVPPNSRWPRAVDLVAIRPADYLARRDGFASFARDYLRLVAAARARDSRSYSAMRSLALLPPWLAAKALKANPQRTRDTFGTVGLSMLKDARVFIAPMADAGWDDGFLAIGNMSLPDSRGGPVAAVTAKGDAKQIRHYPQAIRRAIAACGSC